MKWTTNANDDDLAFEYTPNYNTNAGGFIADWNASSFGGGKFETGMGKGNCTYWTDLFAQALSGDMAPCPPGVQSLWTNR